MIILKNLENELGRKLTLGRFVKTMRELKGLTQQELAQKVGSKSRTYISDIEKDKKALGIKKVLELSKALKIDKEFFIYLYFRDECQDIGVDFNKMIKKVG